MPTPGSCWELGASWLRWGSGESCPEAICLLEEVSPLLSRAGADAPSSGSPPHCSAPPVTNHLPQQQARGWFPYIPKAIMEGHWDHVLNVEKNQSYPR